VTLRAIVFDVGKTLAEPHAAIAGLG